MINSKGSLKNNVLVPDDMFRQSSSLLLSIRTRSLILLRDRF